MLKGRALDHIGLACKDVEANAKWYQEVLGFEVAGKFFGAPGRPPVYFLKNGTTMYEMYQNDNLDPMLQGKIDHISYVSTDIEADYDYAVKQGYQITTNGIEAIERFWANGCRYFKILSPCGEQIEFNQIL